MAQPLPSGDRRLLLTDATDARYVPGTGHLVFMRRGTLWAVPFDPGRLELRGQAVPIVDGLAQALTGTSTNALSGAGQFAVSKTGSLAWLAGAVVPYLPTQLVTVDRRGYVTLLPAEPHNYGPALRLSPDGRRLAVTVFSLAEVGVWIYDLTRTTLTPVNRVGESDWPVWTPDGQRLMFEWLTGGRRSLGVQSVDHPGAAQVLAPGDFALSSWHRDGRTLAGVAHGDMQVATVENEKATVRPLWQTPQAEQWWPEFSPDGRWLAYGSNVSGHFEVYLQAYPGPGEVTRVSLDGGWNPAWHPNGRELFFLSRPDAAGQRRMMAVDFAPGPPLRIGAPRVLFEFDQRDLSFLCNVARCYDVAPDGQHFYVVRTPTRPPSSVVTHINLITNWFEELKARVPTGR